jgi:hypothetical protein
MLKRHIKSFSNIKTFKKILKSLYNHSMSHESFSSKAYFRIKIKLTFFCQFVLLTCAHRRRVHAEYPNNLHLIINRYRLLIMDSQYEERLNTKMHLKHFVHVRNLFNTIIMLDCYIKYSMGCYQYIISNHYNTIII